MSVRSTSSSPCSSPLYLPTSPLPTQTPSANIISEYPLLFLESVTMFLCHMFKTGGIETPAPVLRGVFRQQVENRGLSSTHILLTTIYLHRLLHLNPSALKTYQSAEDVLLAAICLSQDYSAMMKKKPTDTRPATTPTPTPITTTMIPTTTTTTTAAAVTTTTTSAGLLSPPSATLSAQLMHSTTVDSACLLHWKRCLEQKVQKLRDLELRREQLKEMRKTAEEAKTLPLQLSSIQFLSAGQPNNVAHGRGVGKPDTQGVSSRIGERLRTNPLANAWLAGELQQKQTQQAGEGRH